MRGRFHYAWVIVLVTFVTLITTAGFRATPGVLIVPLQEEFGWRRATISLAVSLGLVLFGLTAPWQRDLLWGVVGGGATAAVAVPLAAAIANRWFEPRRGLVT